jgi:hypothetical protein
MFEPCHTAEKCFDHVTLLGNVLAMSHRQKISCQCHGVSGVLVSKKKLQKFLTIQTFIFWIQLFYKIYHKYNFGPKLAL